MLKISVFYLDKQKSKNMKFFLRPTDVVLSRNSPSINGTSQDNCSLPQPKVFFISQFFINTVFPCLSLINQFIACLLSSVNTLFSLTYSTMGVKIFLKSYFNFDKPFIVYASASAGLPIISFSVSNIIKKF